MNTKPTLGTVNLEPGTFEHDVTIAEHYQAFSSELLRISVLGIGAFGFLLSQMKVADVPVAERLVFAGALGFLAITVGFTLVHRYLASDSLACQLASARCETRAAEGDAERADTERAQRNRLFAEATRHLRNAAVSLVLGFGLMALGFGMWLFRA